MQVIETPSQSSSSSSSPSQPQQSSAAAARERAINAYMGNNPDGSSKANTTAQVIDNPTNPNNVSVQELSQLAPTPSAQPDINGSSNKAVETETPSASPTQQDQALSSRYAALARREKALRAQAAQQQATLRAREDALRAREEALRQPSPASSSSQPTFDPNKYVSFEDLQKDPFSHLAKANLSYEQLVEQAMNAPKPEEVRLMNTVSSLEAKIKALESKLGDTEKTIKEQETASYQSAINQIRTDVNSLIRKDPTFETIRVTGQSEEVVKLIEKVYQKGMGPNYPKGTVLDSYEAAQMVEQEVADSLYNWTSKASKVRSRFNQPGNASKPATKAPTSQNPSATQQSQMKTLSNQMNSSRQLTARERAILAAEGKLNKS